MNAPGKSLLKVISILFIIFGAIAFIISLIAVFGTAALNELANELDTDIGGGVLMAASVLALIASVLEIVIGILGLKKCGDPAKAGFFIVAGVALCVLSLFSLILSIAAQSFSAVSLVGFVLPILLIVGGIKNKTATPVEA